MIELSRKTRIESLLKKNFSLKKLIVRDDSKKHEGHSQVAQNPKETHFFIQMVLNNNNITKVSLHRKVYNLLDNEFSSGLHALELDINSVEDKDEKLRIGLANKKVKEILSICLQKLYK